MAVAADCWPQEGWHTKRSVLGFQPVQPESRWLYRAREPKDAPYRKSRSYLGPYAGAERSSRIQRPKTLKKKNWRRGRKGWGKRAVAASKGARWVSCLLETTQPALQGSIQGPAGTPSGTLTGKGANKEGAAALFPSSRLCLQEAAELNIDPYGTMAGLIELAPGGAVQCLDRLARDASGHVGPSDPSGLNRTSASAHQGPAHVGTGDRGANLGQGDHFLRARLEEQEMLLSHLEEENLTLRERLFLAEQELGEMRRRLGGVPSEEVDMEGDSSVVWGGPSND